jgi:Putative adhesin
MPIRPRKDTMQMQMTRRRAVVLPILAVAALEIAAASPATPQAGPSPQSWKGLVLQGSAIEIKGVNGEIRATAAAGSEVEVAAVMKGRRSDPSQVRLDIVQHGDGVTICAMYPSADGRPNECAPGDGGRMNVRDNDVVVTFTVRVPPGVRFVGRTVNGDVTAEGLAGPVTVKTVNGDATFSTSAHGSARTVNGSIRGALGSSQWAESLEFQSVNGSITLDLPADASTELAATTVNGAITTDFPIAVAGRVNGRRLNGTIGGGGRKLELQTVNGSITVRKKE